MQEVEQLLLDIWGSTWGHFRVFHDSLKGDAAAEYAKKYSGEFTSLRPELIAKNHQGCGVYFVVNAGGHTDESITTSTAIMIDLDKGQGLPERWHVQPHLIYERGNNYHAYWLLEATNEIVKWEQTCNRLIQFYQSDRTVKNPSRVMRLPEFNHLKDPQNPSQYRLIFRAVDQMTGEILRYTLDDVAHGLPEYVEPSRQHDAADYETMDKVTIDRAIKHLEGAPGAIEGEEGDHRTFAVAARLRDFGLPEETTLQLMTDHWNHKCEPPWMPDDLQLKVSNVYSYAKNPQGCANPVANFMNAGYLEQPQPVASLDPAVQQPVASLDPAVQQPVASLDPAGADPYMVTTGAGYGKNHTDNAARFVQEWYPGGSLRFIKDDWYYFDGKCWVETSEEAIKRAVATAMLCASPSSSTVNGTVRMLAALMSQRGDLGTFPGRDTRSLIVLQNGILDVSRGMLEPHNRKFFTTNILPYEYDPSATCPSWDAFLADIFEGDPERIQLMQEWLGYQMVRDYSWQKIMLMIGAPRSGKGTIGRVLKQLVGEINYMGMSMEGFSHDGTLEGCLNKTVLWVGDASNVSGPNRSAVVERLKTISGGDEIACARKFKQPFSGVIPARLTIAANNILSFTDDSGALTNRLIICPFNKTFLGREDHTLDARLTAELPGIANKCINALRHLKQRGYFLEPAEAKQERDSITMAYSPAHSFVTTECILTPNGKVFCDELFDRYKLWCLKEGLKPQPRNKFINSIRTALRGHADKGKIRIQGVQAQGFTGISLRPMDVPDNVTPIGQEAS